MTEFEQELGIARQGDASAADIAAETAIELAAGDRPEWLPPNFTEPEALVQSYREAQNKIREQGTELNQLRAFVAAQQTAGLDEWSGEQQEYVDRLEMLQAADPRTMLQQTAALADQQARIRMAEMATPFMQQQSDPAAAAVPGLIAGFQTAASQIPEMEAALPQMNAWLEQHPGVQEQMAQAADPAVAATAWTHVYHAARAGEMQAEMQASHGRAMKLQAQSAVGAGGRPDPVSGDQAEWQKIAAATATAQYWR